MVEFSLLLRALRRHKIIVAILVLEFAITFAILSNVFFLTAQRFSTLYQKSGIQEQRLVIATLHSDGFGALLPSSGILDEAKGVVAAVPGVIGVSIVGQTPFSGNDMWRSKVSRTRGEGGATVDASTYSGDAQAMSVLGFKISSGRWFSREEFESGGAIPELSRIHLVLITRQLANKIFGKTVPLGETLYVTGVPMVVIGVIDVLSRPAYYGADKSEDAIFLPVIPSSAVTSSVAVRMSDNLRVPVEPAVHAITSSLQRILRGRSYWKVSSFQEQRRKYFETDSAALRVLTLALVAISVVALNAISASSGYWVRQRSRHVAIRRAIGATRGQIVAYFLIENAVICMTGLFVGASLAVSVNLWMVRNLGVGFIPPSSFAVGAALLFSIGQAAVLYPSLRMPSEFGRP